MGVNNVCNRLPIDATIDGLQHGILAFAGFEQCIGEGAEALFFHAANLNRSHHFQTGIRNNLWVFSGARSLVVYTKFPLRTFDANT